MKLVMKPTIDVIGSRTLNVINSADDNGEGVVLLDIFEDRVTLDIDLLALFGLQRNDKKDYWIGLIDAKVFNEAS